MGEGIFFLFGGICSFMLIDDALFWVCISSHLSVHLFISFPQSVLSSESIDLFELQLILLQLSWIR